MADGATGDITLTLAATPTATPGATWTATGVKVAVAAPGTDAVTTDQVLATVAAAAVTISATVTPIASAVLPGASTTLDFTVRNTGLSDAVGTHINVVAPPGTTLGTPTGTTAAACTVSPDQSKASCALNLTASGAPIPLSFPLKVDASAVPGQPLTGGCIDLNADGVCSGSDQAIGTINVATPLDQRVTVSTTAAQPTPGLGGNAHVLITAPAGSIGASGLTVTVPLAPLPSWVTVGSPVTNTGACTTTGTQIVCTGVAVTTGSATDVTIPLTVDPSAAPGISWTVAGITAAVGGETATGSGVLATVGDRVTATTPAVPAGGTIAAGGTANVTVTVTNGGPSDAPDATFVVIAPTGTTLDPLPGATRTAGCTSTNATVATCRTSLAAGTTTTTLTFPVLVPASADPTVPLTGGCVDLDQQAGCTGANDQAIPAITLAVPLNRLVSVTADPATVTPGDAAVAATVHLTALQATALGGLTVTVPLSPLPAGATATYTSTTTGGACAIVGGQIQCTGVAVPAASTRDIVLHVAVPAGTAPGTRWTSAITVANAAAETVSASRVLAIAGPAQFTLATSAAPLNPVPEPGQTGDLVVSVADNGPSDATGASFGVIAPAGATFGTLSAPESGFCQVVSPTRVSCQTSVLASTPIAVHLPLKIDAAADPSQALTGGCLDADNDGQCGPGDPALSVALSTPFSQIVTVTTTPASAPPGGAPGTANVVVAALQPVGNLTVTIPDGSLPGSLPGGISVGAPITDTSGPDCTDSSGTITCSGVNAASGSPATIAVPVTASGSTAPTAVWAILPPGIQVTDGLGGLAVGGGVMARAGIPNFTLNAVVTPPATASVLPGGTVPLTVTIDDHTGPADATSAPVIVQAPAGTTFGTLTGPAATACTVTSATALSCLVTVPQAGPAVTWTLPLTVASTTSASTPISGGCIDVGAGCGTLLASPYQLRTPLSDVVTASSDNPAIVPGDSRPATLTLSSTAAALSGLGVSIDTGSLPAGLTVTGATLNGGAGCSVGPAAVTCPAAGIAANGSTAVALTVAAQPTATPGATWTPSVTVTQDVDRLVLQPVTAHVAAADANAAFSVAVPAAGTLAAGSTGDLDVTVTNTGRSTKFGVRALFKAPANTTFAALSAATANYCTLTTPTSADCTLDVPPGSTSFLLPVAVPPTATSVGALCVDTDGDGTCDQTFAALTLQQPFSSRVTVTVVPDTATPGNPATAHVTLLSATAQNGLKVNVPLAALPAGFTLIGAAGPQGSTCTLGNTEIVCTGVNVPANVTTDLVAVTVGTSASLPAGGSWVVSPVLVTDSNGDSTHTGGNFVTTGTPASALTYAVTASTGVQPGGAAMVTVSVSNNGPSDATAVTVPVLAPNGTSFGPLTAPTSSVCTAAGATRLNCVVSVAAWGTPVQLSVPVQIPAATTPNTTLTGGCVDADRDGACGAAPDTLIPVIQVNPTLAQAVTVTSSNPHIVPGRTGTATVTVSSARTGTLSVAIPTGGLPAGMTVSQAGSSGTACTTVTGTITCAGIGITAGGTATITLNVVVGAGAAPAATWSPTVTISDGTETAIKAVTPVAATIGAADVNLAASVVLPADNTLYPGDTGTMAVTIANQGTSNATGARYAIEAPAGLTFRPVTGTTAAVCSRTSATLVDCTVNVNGNARTQVSLPFDIAAGANPAVALTGGCVDAGANGSCTGAGDAAIPDLRLASPLSVAVQINGTSATVIPGSSGTGTVRIVSPTAYANATVTVPLTALPAGLTVTGASGPTGTTCTLTGPIVCSGVNVVAGATPISLVVRAAANLGSGVTWHPTGIVLTAGSQTTSGDAVLAVTGAPAALLTWRVSGPGGSVAPGDTSSLTITATNSGPSDTTAHAATVVAPSHTTFGPLTGRAATDCTAATSKQLTCTFGLAVADSLSWTVPLVVDQTAVDGDQITGGCVSADGNSACGGNLDAAIGTTPVKLPLSTHGTVTVGTADVKAGASGAAHISISATAAYTDLTLSVPLGALPTGITVTGATLSGATCTVGASAITCTGVDLTANQSTGLDIGVAVASGITEGATWPVAAVTLDDPGDTGNSISAAGVLVTTGDTTQIAVAVTVDSPTVSAPPPGQTTILPITVTNTGTIDADPYPVRIVLPTHTTHGTLPTGCAEGATADIVNCQVSLPVGVSRTINLPVIVVTGTDPDLTIDDGALTAGPPVFDNTCGGDQDVPIPGFTVGHYKVNLSIVYAGPTLTPAAGR